MRLVLQSVGPKESRVAEAFQFASSDERRPKRRRVRQVSPQRRESNFSEYDPDVIENDLANDASLFARADTFWQAVGWTFNCSFLHKKRWDRWSLWLEYMIDLLQADWNSCHDDETKKAQSLIVRYIIGGNGPTDSGRKIIRAVFADGQGTSAAEFPEIWRNETKELKAKNEADGKTSAAERADGIDIEADDYGDYLTSSSENEDFRDDEHQVEESDTGVASNTNQTIHIASSSSLGGSTALHLRYRLLALLSSVANSYPYSFTNSTSPSHLVSGTVTADLYTLIASYLRSFPLSTFHLLFSPRILLAAFPPDAASVLTQCLLHRIGMIEVAAGEPESYALTQETLVESYLPWAANANDDTERANLLRSIKSSTSKSSTTVNADAKGKKYQRKKPRRSNNINTTFDTSPTTSTSNPAQTTQTPTILKEIDLIGLNEAKVSICIETLLRLLDGPGGGISLTPDFEDAVERGIQCREIKVRKALAEFAAAASGGDSSLGSSEKINDGNRSGARGGGGGGRGRGRGRGRKPTTTTTTSHSHPHTSHSTAAATPSQRATNDKTSGETLDGGEAWLYLRASSNRIRGVVALIRDRERESQDF